jgi:guanylate kinase
MPRHGLDHRGVLFVLSSPSGAGKSTIARMLLASDPDIAMSVSVTTRPPRPGEIDGEHYHFVDVPRFKEMVADGELLEWAHVFDNRYGTPEKPVLDMLATGRDVLFDIDWQGGGGTRPPAGPTRHGRSGGYRRADAAGGVRDQPLGRL